MRSPLNYALGLTSLLLILFIESSCLAANDTRFFLQGSGKMHLHNLRNNRTDYVQLVDEDGTIDEAELVKVDRVFGFPTNEKKEHISLRMLFMLSHFSDRFAPGKTIYIESAYRSPEYNEQIRKRGANAAKTSTHIDGLALDFWLEGVDGKYMWETIRAEDCCGVGHYGGKSIHLDAGRPRFWEAATSGTGKREPDHNRNIYLSSRYDMYRTGETVDLSLSSISVFDFSISTSARLLPAGQDTSDGIDLEINIPSNSPGTCKYIDNRQATRFLSTILPQSVVPGRYQIEVSFCEKPFVKMPAAILTREIEITSSN